MLTQQQAQKHANKCGMTEGMATPLHQVKSYLNTHSLHLAYDIHSPETRELIASDFQKVTPELVDYLESFGIDYICLYQD